MKKAEEIKPELNFHYVNKSDADRKLEISLKAIRAIDDLINEYGEGLKEIQCKIIIRGNNISY